MYYTIYKVTNKINGKFYIGKHQTKDLDDGYMGSGKLLKRAIKKHGLENFTKEILYIFESEDEMNTKEKELVIISEQSYNLCEGGKGGFGYINSLEKNLYGKNGQLGYGGENLKLGSFLGYKHSEETKAKLRITQNKTWIGRKHKEETKEKMKGHTFQCGSKNSQYGKPRSEETKRKISESLKRRNVRI